MIEKFLFKTKVGIKSSTPSGLYKFHINEILREVSAPMPKNVAIEVETTSLKIVLKLLNCFKLLINLFFFNRNFIFMIFFFVISYFQIPFYISSSSTNCWEWIE